MRLGRFFLNFCIDFLVCYNHITNLYENRFLETNQRILVGAKKIGLLASIEFGTQNGNGITNAAGGKGVGECAGFVFAIGDGRITITIVAQYSR
jgi:hypothetical protein